MGSAWLTAAVCLAAGAVGAAVDEPTHQEIDPIRVDVGPNGKIDTLAMDNKGNLLVGVSWPTDGAPAQPPVRRKISKNETNPFDDGRPRNYALRILSPAGKQLATWKLEGQPPGMIHGCADGTVIIGGGDRLSLFNDQGRATKFIRLGDILQGRYAGAHVSGLTANDRYIFIAFGHGFSVRAIEDIVRLRRDLSDPKVIVEEQYGCCSHIDLDTQGDVLLVAENSRHRVNGFTFDGDLLGSWGRRDRTGIEGFAACCNPVNFDFGPGGVLYTAESGIGRVKRYKPDGEFLGLVGYVDTTRFDSGSMLAAQSCYIPVEVSADGRRVYVMDVRANIIRVLAAQ